MLKPERPPVIVPFFISHRGCPHQCVFCDQKALASSDGALPSAAAIRDRIALYQATSGGRPVEVAFYGGSFTCLDCHDQHKLLDPIQSLRTSGAVVSIRVSTRPDAVDAPCLDLLQSLGVTTVELGVQSMHDDVLQLSGRGHTREHVVQAVSLLREKGFTIGLQIMPGLPGDDFHSSLSSCKQVLALEPEFLRIYPTVVLAGTPLAERFTAGTFLPLSLHEAVSRCKIMLHAAMRAGVPVIRMGLQATDGLGQDGVVLAGPYHPAFRHLVQSELYYDLLVALLSARTGRYDSVTVRCAPARVADVVGHCRENIRLLHRDHGITITAIERGGEMAPGTVTLIDPAGEYTGTILDDLHYP